MGTPILTWIRSTDPYRSVQSPMPLWKIESPLLTFPEASSFREGINVIYPHPQDKGISRRSVIFPFLLPPGWMTAYAIADV